MNPLEMTESHFGIDPAERPFFSDDLVTDVEAWMERPLTDAERQRLRDLCATRPEYCERPNIGHCRECSLRNYTRDCQNNQVGR